MYVKKCASIYCEYREDDRCTRQSIVIDNTGSCIYNTFFTLLRGALEEIARELEA